MGVVLITTPDTFARKTLDLPYLMNPDLVFTVAIHMRRVDLS